MLVIPKLSIKHLFLICIITAFIKFFFTSNYLDVLLIVAFCVCYFIEEFKLYQMLQTESSKDVAEMKVTVNKILDGNRVLSDRINEVRSASSISKAFSIRQGQ